MRTDHWILTGLLLPLCGHVERITARADDQARAAGLSVEAGPGGVRRYRDPRMDQLTAARRPSPCAGVRVEPEPPTAAWSTPTLSVSASLAGAGWSR